MVENHSFYFVKYLYNFIKILTLVLRLCFELTKDSLYDINKSWTF